MKKKNINDFSNIFSLEGLPFIKGLLKFEEERFDAFFSTGSVYEEMNIDFGIFPPEKVYPMYFMGDITKPENKIIFIGINPGYNKEHNKAEQKFLEEKSSFDGYCTFFKHRGETLRRSAYFSNIGGFLRRIGLLEGNITPEWLHNHFINMDLIPYHSTNASGLRINDIQKYRDRYFVSIVKIIKYLNPKRPIFIVGFPTFEKYLENPIFKGMIDFKKQGSVWTGTIDGKYPFIGLPFLNRVAGGKDKLVEIVKGHL